MIRHVPMSEVTPELLNGLNEPVRFVDANDDTLGYYEPFREPVAGDQIDVRNVTPDRLIGLKDSVSIVDDAGNPIGGYYPQPDPADWDKYIEELPPEERERRINAGGRPLADYLAEIDLS